MVSREGDLNDFALMEAADELDEEAEDTAADELEVHRAAIEQTRAEMGQTIDEIKHRLDPEVLAEKAKTTVHDMTVDVLHQAKQTVHDATIGKAQEAMDTVARTTRRTVDDTMDTVRDMGYSAADVIRENPVPFALIGIGLGWLLVNRARGHRHHHTEWCQDDYMPRYMADVPCDQMSEGRRRYRMGGYYNEDVHERPVREFVDRTKERAGEVVASAGEMVDTAREKVSDVADRTRERAGEMVDRIQERTGEMVDRVQYRAQNVAYRAQERWDDVRYTARQQVDRASDIYDRSMEENPLVVGAIAMGVGAAIGLMIPETPYEHRVMGETRDRLMDKAQVTARDLGQKVRSVADEAVDTVSETAREQGLVK
jgi:ElaB/YqjD/DUF883 family membrane-anchored ribosome-binding protein